MPQDNLKRKSKRESLAAAAIGNKDSHKLRIWLNLLLSLLLPVRFFTLFSLDLAAAQGPVSSINIEVRDGSLTLDLRDAPLAEVLEAIGEQAGIAIEIRGDLTTRITNSFTHVPLDEGIHQLLRGQSFALSYVPSASDARRSRLVEISLIAGSTTGPTGGAKKVSAQRERREPSDIREKLQRIQALARRKDGEAIGELSSLAGSEPSPIVRSQAVAALGRLKNPEALAPLTRALADQSYAVRIPALRGIKALKGTEAMKDLRAMLVNDPEPKVRSEAVRLLSDMQSPEVPGLLQGAVADFDPAVSQAANQAVRRWEQRFGAQYGLAGRSR